MNEAFSLRERLYSALSDISCADVITDDVVLNAVRNWTTDDTSEDGLLGEDSLELSSYIIQHIHTQKAMEEHFDQARRFQEKLNENGIDADKLAAQDPEESHKLFELILEMRGEIEEENFETLPDDFDLADILGAIDDDHAIVEETTDVRVRETLIAKINAQTRVSVLLHAYLSSVLNNDSATAHAIINSTGCGLVHGLTSLFLSWIQTRMTIGPDESLESWVEQLKIRSEEIFNLPDDEKIELAKRMMEVDDED